MAEGVCVHAIHVIRWSFVSLYYILVDVCIYMTLSASGEELAALLQICDNGSHQKIGSTSEL